MLNPLQGKLFLEGDETGLLELGDKLETRQ